MPKIVFDPAGHKYTDLETGLQLMSTSHFRKLFDPTDWDHNVKKKASQKYLKSRYDKLKKEWESKGGHILDPAFITFLMKHMDKETFEKMCLDVRAEWDETGRIASGKGTVKHDEREQQTIIDGFCINPYNSLEYPTQPHGKKPDGTNCNIVDRLSDLEPGFYGELLIWYLFPDSTYSKSMETEIIGICGTSDRVFIEPDSCLIRDYKFPGEPKYDFATDYKNHGYEYHSAPWEDWRITKLSGYRQQLNTYGYMMDTHGLPPQALHLDIESLDGKQNDSILVRYEPDRVGEGMDRVFMDGL